MPRIARLWPLLLIAGALAAALVTGAQHWLDWSVLSANLESWRSAVAGRPMAAAGLYFASYVAMVAVSIPGGMWLTMVGGLLFGAAEGAALAVVGSTCGAVVLFLAVRHALAPMLADRARPLLARVGPALARDGLYGLLALRLLPVLPFWLLNLVPALVGMPLATFATATLLGIVPATFVFASVGAGLGEVLARGGAPDLSVLFSARVILPLAGLAMLAVLPIGWRRWA